MKAVVLQCTNITALEPMVVSGAPPKVMKHVVKQFGKILPHDVTGKKSFVLSGSLQKLQQLNAEPGSKLREYVDEVNRLYPPEIVNFYSPSYPETLMKRLDEFAATS